MNKCFFTALIFLCLGFSAKSQSESDTTAEKIAFDTLKASELIALPIDSIITSFTISTISRGQLVEIKVQGNKLPKNAKQMILRLNPGTKVYYQQIRARSNGQIRRLPDKNYLIK